jgi:dynein heavy chain, axonemal
MNQETALFEAKLELTPPHVLFFPSFDARHKYGLLKLIEGLIVDIYHMSDVIPCVAQPTESERTDAEGQVQLQTYSSHLAKNLEIEKLKQEIIYSVHKTMQEANTYVKDFNIYSYLWVEDRNKVLERFLKYGKVMTSRSDYAEFHENLPDEHIPVLDDFKKQIDFFLELYEEVAKIGTYQQFSGWLMVDMRSFKHTILNMICKWSNTFKQYLVQQVEGRLQELDDFIVSSTAVLRMEATEDDFETLLKILSVITQIKEREVETDNMFEPLKEVVALLKTYNEDFNEAVYNQFVELPDKWLGVKKTALQVRQAIAPIQAYQVDLIRKRISLFDFRCKLYRDQFRKLPVSAIAVNNFLFLTGSF